MKPLTFERGRGVYRIDVTHGLAHVILSAGEDEARTERIQAALRALADRDIPIFLIKLHRSSLSFAVDSRRAADVESCLQSTAGERSTRPGLSLITVVATSMRDLNDVMVTTADALQRAGARLYGMGDSHNTLQCLVETTNAERAAAELRAGFGLEERR